MGRHSIPDPDEPDDVADDHADDVADAQYSYDDESDEDYSGEPGQGSQSDYQEPGFDDYSAGPGKYQDDPPTERHDALVEDNYDYRYDHDDHDDQEGYDYGAPAPLAAQPALNPQASGGHRNEGEWTGSHRTVAPGRRGISVGVIAALVTVVAVVAGFILWRFFGDALSDRSDVAAGRCLQGEAKVAVIADLAIADSVGQFASKFNETAGPVGDHCVAVSVTAADSAAVIDGLTGTWPENFGDKPALWIPGSSVSAARLQAAAGPESVSASNSLVTSPVLIASHPELKPALEQQRWASLPGLQSDPAALDNLNLAGWGSLRLALPKTGDSDASYLAAEAVAAAAAPAGAPADAGMGAVNTLFSGAPKLADSSADEAMKVLLDGGDPAAAQVHAVVITEQQLIKRAAAVSDAKNVLSSWLPPGPTAVADFPAVLLAGDWLGEDQVAAASEFERFIREPEQMAELAKAGFRVDGSDPPTSDVTSGTPVTETLSVGDDSARVALANALGTAVSGNGPAVTIMLDRSLNLTPVAAALTARLNALPAGSAVGLTAFDGSVGSSLVNLGALTDDVDGQPRRDVLASVLNGLTPTGGAVSFTTLRNVYAEALTDFRPGQSNSVLVITSGPHTDQSLDAAGLQDLIQRSVDPARPVAVDVINVGNDPDRATWESVAQISGGTFQSVPASDSPEMVAAINALLA